MKITIDIPEGKSKRVLDAFCKHYSYKKKISKIDSAGVETFTDNPMTKEEFMIARLKDTITSAVHACECETQRADLVEPEVIKL